MVQLLPATVLLGYGAARAASSLCNELRNAVFAKVTLLPCPSHLSSYPSLRSCPQRSCWAVAQRAEHLPSALAAQRRVCQDDLRLQSCPAADVPNRRIVCALNLLCDDLRNSFLGRMISACRVARLPSSARPAQCAQGPCCAMSYASSTLRVNSPFIVCACLAGAHQCLSSCGVDCTGGAEGSPASGQGCLQGPAPAGPYTDLAVPEQAPPEQRWGGLRRWRNGKWGWWPRINLSTCIL